MEKIKDGLSEDAFNAAEAKLSGIDGQGSQYGLNLHSSTPSIGSHSGIHGALSPGREASVKKAAAASVAVRQANAKPKLATSKMVRGSKVPNAPLPLKPLKSFGGGGAFGQGGK